MRTAIKAAFRTVVNRLPTPLKGRMNLFAHDLPDVLGQRQEMSLYRGELRSGGGTASFAHFGQSYFYRHWLARLFAEPPEASVTGSFAWREAAARGELLAGCDAVLHPVNSLTEAAFARAGWHILPRIVYCEIDLRRPLAEILKSRDVKNEIRVLRKMDYRFEMLHTPEALEEWYHEMLVPTVLKRHQELAHVSNLDAVRRAYEHGGLLAAYRGSEWVGANLVVRHNDRILRSANVGWRNADDELFKARIVSAILHELIQRAQAEGYQTLHLGTSNPFVDDGPLIYKLKWGADLALPQRLDDQGELNEPGAFVAAWFDTDSERGREILRHTPLLVTRDGHIGVIGWQSRMPPEFRSQVAKGIEWRDLAPVTTSDRD